MCSTRVANAATRINVAKLRLSANVRPAITIAVAAAQTYATRIAGQHDPASMSFRTSCAVRVHLARDTLVPTYGVFGAQGSGVGRCKATGHWRMLMLYRVAQKVCYAIGVHRARPANSIHAEM